jgi:hypothetical protein
MRSFRTFLAIAACAVISGFSSAQESTPEEKASGLLSPDRKWEYVDGDTPKLVKAGTNEVALDFLEQCNLGAIGEHSAPLWAPDLSGSTTFNE